MANPRPVPAMFRNFPSQPRCIVEATELNFKTLMLFFRSAATTLFIFSLGLLPAKPVLASATGAALEQALAYMARSPAQADRQLATLKSSVSHLDDVLDYYRALAAKEVDAVDGMKRFQAFLANHPGSVLYEQAAADLGGILESLGRTAELSKFADSHARKGEGSVERSAICLAAGRATLQEPRRALIYLDCARRQAPRGKPATEARELTDRLIAQHPSLAPRGESGLWAEASLRASEGDNATRAQLLDRFLVEYPTSARRTQAILSRAKAFPSKAEGGAYLASQAAKARSEATKIRLTYESAYAYWNANDDPGATRGFQNYLKLRSSGAEAGLAHYALGRIHESAGRSEEAIAAYGRAAAIGSFDRRVESRWRRGWAALRAGNPAAAAKFFKTMADAAPRGSASSGRAEALYWQARSLEKAGRASEAVPLFNKVLAEFPDGYYASAVERHRGLRPAPLSTRILKPDYKALDKAATRAWLRAKDLGEAGLVALALSDLESSLKTLPAASRRALLPTLEGIGASGLAFRQAIDLNKRGLLTQAELRPFLYPRANRAFVESLAKERGLDPIVIWSLMRQESAFDAGAVSPAQALGLMQLLSKTAERMAPAAGVTDASRAKLFDPHTNIRLGTAYLGGLFQEFGGRIELALAAYNAGETAAARWQKAGVTMDDDELIESITYRETRDYVKKILRNARNYRRVWR